MTGVAWVGIDLESLVDDGVWCVNIDFSCSVSQPSRACGRVSCLCTDVSDWAVHVGMHEFGVILVHDFLVDEHRVFCLLDEELLEEEQLGAQQNREGNGRDEGDGRTRIADAGG